jgi:hypothetical protein
VGPDRQACQANAVIDAPVTRQVATSRGALPGRASPRTLLYTVATRSCLKQVEARGHRAMPMDLGPASERVVADATP